MMASIAGTLPLDDDGYSIEKGARPQRPCRRSPFERMIAIALKREWSMRTCPLEAGIASLNNRRPPGHTAFECFGVIGGGSEGLQMQ